MPNQRFLIIALALLGLAACQEAPDDRPGQPVAHRRAAFKKILLASEPIGTQFHDKQYNPDRMLEQAQSLARLKNEPWPYFEGDTNYPPTHAKPEVWSHPDQFKAAQQTFTDAVDRLVAATEKRDEAQTRAAFEAVQDSCRSCHKAFRE